MTKRLDLGVASRFALLGIEDEDDDDEPAVAKSAQTKKPNQKKTKFVSLSTASSTSEKAKKAAKKQHKKVREVDFDDDDQAVKTDNTDDMEEALRVSRMTYEAEEKRRLDFVAQGEEWGKAAFGTANNSGDKTRNMDNGIIQSAEEDDTVKADHIDDEIDEIVMATKAEARRIISSMRKERQDGEIPQEALAAVVKLYKSKFEEFAAHLKESKGEHEALHAKLTKVRDRQKLYCQLLADAECREKAELAHEARTAQKLNEELMQQVSDLHKELEQVRSRLHELESEQKKHSKVAK